MIVCHMLDTVWHQVGPRIEQLVGDLSVLRRMLGWMLTDAANIIFQYAKRWCYVTTAHASKAQTSPYVNLNEDEDAWEAL